MTVDLTSNPLIPMASALLSIAPSIIWLTVCLIPILTTRYPLLVRIMSTRFFPMSCTSPRTVARSIVPRPSSPVFSMNGSSIATAVFITSALCSTKGSCISPLPNNSPTTFIPSSKWELIISSGGIPSAIADFRSSSRPTFSPSIIRRCNRSKRGSAASASARAFLLVASSTPSNNCKNSWSGSYVHSSPSKTLRS